MPRDLFTPPPEALVSFEGLPLNERMTMDGREFLALLPPDTIPAAFFDPQMSDAVIREFIAGIHSALVKSGHLFLWLNKDRLCSGFTDLLGGTPFDVVDMVTWDKGRGTIGYLLRQQSEHLVILQKQPRRAKGVWTVHNITDIWQEGVTTDLHTHRKPPGLQARLIEVVTNEGDVVIDPAAGSYSVMEACRRTGRNFLGCDIAASDLFPPST